MSSLLRAQRDMPAMESRCQIGKFSCWGKGLGALVICCVRAALPTARAATLGTYGCWDVLLKVSVPNLRPPVTNSLYVVNNRVGFPLWLSPLTKLCWRDISRRHLRFA